MTALIHDEDLLLQAYFDGELNPDSVAEFERRLAGDESLRARHDQILALRRALLSFVEHDIAPRLHAGAMPMIDAKRPRARSRSWQALAASAVFGAIFASTITMMINQHHAHQDNARQIIATHIRG